MIARVEPLEKCWGEIAALWTEYFVAIGEPLRLDARRYLELEAAGNTFAVVARAGGELVGFAILYTFPSMHDQALEAREDFFLVAPWARGKWVWRRLLDAAEAECVRRGCREVTMTTEVGSMAGAILSAVGYGKVGETYRRSLVRADSPLTERAVA